VRQPQVDTNLGRNRGLCLNLIGAKHGHEVPARAVLADGYGRHDCGLRNGARKANIQCTRLGNLQDRTIPVKSTGGVFGRLCAVLPLESRVLVATGEEVTKRSLQVTKRLLNGDAGNFVQPRELFSLFQRGQHRRGLVIPDLFLTLKPRISALTKHVVIGETSAAERLGKMQLLLRRRVEPKSIGAFRFHATILHEFLELCKQANGRIQKDEPQRHEAGRAFGVRHEVQAQSAGRDGAGLAPASFRNGLHGTRLQVDLGRRRVRPLSSAGRVPADHLNLGVGAAAQGPFQQATPRGPAGYSQTILERCSMDPELFRGISGRRTAVCNQEVRRQPAWPEATSRFPPRAKARGFQRRI